MFYSNHFVLICFVASDTDRPCFMVFTSCKVQSHVIDLWGFFLHVKGREVQPGEFWDVVVLTAMDQDQRKAYELQIAEKLKRKALPRGVDYKIFSDPPGFKIGGFFRPPSAID